MFRDSYNVMWIGTWDGLNSYNSRTIKVYNHDPYDENSLSSNVVREIIEQRPGIIWVATDNGVNRMDLAKNRLKRFYCDFVGRKSLVEHSFMLARTAHGLIFCAVRQFGLAVFDESRGDFISFNVPGLNLFDIKGMCSSGNDLLILDDSGILHRLSISVGAEGEVKLGYAGDFSSYGRFDKLKTSADFIVLYGKDSGITLVAQDDYSIKAVASGRKGFNSADISDISCISDKEVFIGFTSGGILKWYPVENVFECVPDFEKTSILSIVQYGNTLWAGTDGKGAIVCINDDRRFGVIYNEELTDNSNPVRCFAECGDILLVGTKGSGIFNFSYNGKSLHFNHIVSGASGLSNLFVYSMVNAEGDDVFVGTDGQGIDVYNVIDNTVHGMDMTLLENNGDIFRSVYDMYYDHAKKTLWVGTSGFGLLRMVVAHGADGKYKVTEYERYMFDPENENTIGNNTVYAILPELKGNGLWVGTRGGGLNLYDMSTGCFRRFGIDGNHSGTLSSQDVLSLAYDLSGRLWIGTSFGLNCLESYQNGNVVFTRFTKNSGLPNNTIHGIIPAGHELWMSTNNGVSKIDINGQIVNYFAKDGLQNNEFSDGACYKSENGTLYFGGIDGFNFFDPSDMKNKVQAPEIYISEFCIFNDIEERYNNVFLKQSAEGVILRHDQNFFRIGFVALDYADTGFEYSYKLDGFNDDWVIAAGNDAVFTNVPPGKYVFRVRSTDSAKDWVDNEVSFFVRIRYPWWNTWWAYFVYCVLFCILCFGFFYAIKKYMVLNQDLLLERMNKQKQQDIHEAKLRFFTNIAHEFSTPLTLIFSPCERLLESSVLSSGDRKYVGVIYSNAVRMQGLIKELMEFRKVETDHKKIVQERIDMNELINCILKDFEEIRCESGVDFTIDLNMKNDILSDRECVEKILFNLISNAYKYTPHEGKVAVKAELSDCLEIRVSNTGKGIRQENLEKVFDRFQILDNFERQASQGKIVRTGIGLALTKDLVTLLGGKISVESIPDEKTTFIVRIPVLICDDIANAGMTEAAEKDEYSKHKQVYNVQKGGLTGLTILIVDDDSQIRDFVGDIFPDASKILKAANGREAEGCLKDYRPDIIICDIVMPECDGYEFLKIIRENPFTANIPVVFLSSEASTDNKVESYELGVEEFVEKPFHPRHLRAVVEKIIFNRKQLKDYYNSIVSNSELYSGKYISGRDKDFLMRLNGIIEGNLQNDEIDLDSIASMFAVSRMQLYRRVKELTGMTPSEYIRSVKLTFAAHLLTTTEMTVQEIMYHAGFNNKSYFYREFNKKFGQSPKTYRQNLS